MIYIDENGLKYRAIKKDNNYYLLMHYTKSDNTDGEKIEVKGKQNVLIYIKNNKLKKYDDKEIKKEEPKEIRKETKEISWWM